MTRVASAVASVPLNTAAAVETTWAGASDLLREAAEETRTQVSAASAACVTGVCCGPENGNRHSASLQCRV